MKEKTQYMLIIAGFAVIAAASVTAVVFDRPTEPLILTYQSTVQNSATQDAAPETTKRKTEKSAGTKAVSGDTSTKRPPQTESVTAEQAEPERNLNAADSEALKRVEGIGDVLAEAIIAYRDAHGGFTRRSELLEISGIGAALQERIMSAFYIPDELPEESAQPPSESQIPEEPQPQEIPETTVPEVRRYDLNTVSRSELMQIPGMTDRIADGILALREQFGRFGNIYELDLADGMDGTYFEEVLREYLYVE